MRLRAVAAGLLLLAPRAAAASEVAADPSLPRPTLAEPNEPARVQPLDASAELVAPRLPTPFMQKELAHPRIDAWMSWTLASVVPQTPSGSNVATGLLRVGGEAHVFLFRRFYLGAQLPIAFGRGLDGAPELRGGPPRSQQAIVGNLDLEARIVFPMPSWLAFGASVGLAVPTATFDRNGHAQAAARAAIAVAPSDLPLFLPGRLTWRPALDVRILRGPLVVQMRQGIDIVQDTSEAGATTQGRIVAHAGILVSRDLELSVEAQQLYRFSEDLGVQGRRSSVVLGPAARVSVGRFDVGGMLASSLLGALGREMSSVLSVQASVAAHLP